MVDRRLTPVPLYLGLHGEYALALVAAVGAQLSGVANTFGRVIVAMFGAFAVGYAYFRFVERTRP